MYLRLCSVTNYLKVFCLPYTTLNIIITPSDPIHKWCVFVYVYSPNSYRSTFLTFPSLCPQTLWLCRSQFLSTRPWSWPRGSSSSITVLPQWGNLKTHRESDSLNPSVLLCHSPKIHSDSEHSISWQPWCKCITVHEQMKDQGSVCKLWYMVALNAPLAFSLLRLLPRQGNCLRFLFINQKMEVNLAISPSSLFFLFISFMPRKVWWTSFAYVKLQRSIWLSATWIFMPDALWWVCIFLVCVCVCCLIMCV